MRNKKWWVLSLVPAVAILSQPADAQSGRYVREGYGTVYGYLGGAAGGAVGGVPGGLAGGYAGQQFGYGVYDNTARSLQGLRSAPPPSYNVYPSPNFRTHGSTPMMIRRRY